VNAPRDQRTKLATSAVNQVTSHETAPTPQLRALDVAVVDTLPVAVVDKSATSAPRSAISPVTAQKVDRVVSEADTVADKVDMEVVKEDSVVDVVKEDRPATLAVVTDTCLVTAPKDRSATTVAKSAISPATAHPRPLPSELATSASSPATSKLSALTKRCAQ